MLDFKPSEDSDLDIMEQVILAHLLAEAKKEINHLVKTSIANHLDQIHVAQGLQGSQKAKQEPEIEIRVFEYPETHDTSRAGETWTNPERGRLHYRLLSFIKSNAKTLRRSELAIIWELRRQLKDMLP